MDAKLSIKFENGILEQTYKLKDNPLVTNVEEIKAWLDNDFYSEVDAHFAAMQQTAVNAASIREPHFKFGWMDVDIDHVSGHVHPQKTHGMPTDHQHAAI